MSQNKLKRMALIKHITEFLFYDEAWSQSWPTCGTRWNFRPLQHV